MADTDKLRTYKVGEVPSLPGSDKRYLADELKRISEAINLLVQTAKQDAAEGAAAAADAAAAWTAYTPTVSVTSGAGTATGRYKRLGKTVHLHVDVTVTTGGSALVVSLPAGMTAVGITHIVGREVTATGSAHVGIVTGTAFQVVRYDNAVAVTTGWRIILGGTIEIA